MECNNLVDSLDPDAIGCKGETVDVEEKPSCFDQKPIKQTIYWHSSKEDNYCKIEDIEDDHPHFFDGDEAKQNFIYTGYEVECETEIHPNGEVFVTHFMGIELKEKVRI